NDPSTDRSCAHQANDVTNTASDIVPTPVYIYTLGLKLDTTDDKEKKNIKTLEDLATNTGGLFNHLSASNKLSNTFVSLENSLSKQLKSQYILTYQSNSASGDHTLVVSVNKPGQATPLDIDTRKFSLSPLPPLVTFTSPLNNDKVGDSMNIAVSLAKQDAVVIKRVVFKVNNNEVGED